MKIKTQHETINTLKDHITLNRTFGTAPSAPSHLQTVNSITMSSLTEKEN